MSDQLKSAEVERAREFRAYVLGISLALALTLMPFALVYWSVITRFGLLVAIGVFGFVQMIVHFRFFLHINPPKQNTDDLLLIAFSLSLVAIMVGGTVWILYNLAMRMML